MQTTCGKADFASGTSLNQSCVVTVSQRNRASRVNQQDYSAQETRSPEFPARIRTPPKLPDAQQRKSMIAAYNKDKT